MRRRPPRTTRTHTRVPYATLFRSLADHEDRLALVLEGDGGRLAPVGQQADAADGRRGQDRAASAGRLGFVVEADVARHDREVERLTRFAQDRKSTRLNSSH